MDQILLKLSMDPNIREAMHKRDSRNRERLLPGADVVLRNIAETHKSTDSPVISGQEWDRSQVPAETIVDVSATDQPAANAHL